MSFETARTEYLNVGDARFAFRRLGPTGGTPLILLQHFTGTMDAWDPYSRTNERLGERVAHGLSPITETDVNDLRY